MSKVTGVHDWTARLPKWLRIVVAVAMVVLGAVLITRPTTSLDVLALLIGSGLVISGLATVMGKVASVRRASRILRISIGGVLIAAGVFVLVFADLTVRMVAVIVGVLLIVEGISKVVTGLAQRADARVAAVASGAAGATFGVLALCWPDITLLVVAVVFGARLIIWGVMDGWAALGRGRRDESGRFSILRRWSHTAAAVGALILALIAGSVSVGLSEASPVVDDFYAAPRTVPANPGQLVRAEAFTTEVPQDAQAWRILYTTTRGDGSAAVSSGLVVVPRTGNGSWPVIAWAHGTTGFAQNCAPSLLTQPFESGALFVLPKIIEQGWAVVATDYIGLGTKGPHPYLVGVDSAHAELDAIRAARELTAANLSDKTVVWGHSQGGGAALWTGAIAASYAPEISLSGVAALAPASDLTGLVTNLPKVPGGSVFASFVIAGYSGSYPDVTWREYVRPGAEETVRAMSQRCLSSPDTLVSVLQALALSNDPDILAADPTTGSFGERLRQNIPPATISAPLLLAQGASDPLVVPSAQDAYVAGLCTAGQQVDYRKYSGRSHVSLVQADSPLVPDLFAWTKARFAGQSVTPGCTYTN